MLNRRYIDIQKINICYLYKYKNINEFDYMAKQSGIFSFSDLYKEMSKNSKWGGLMSDGAMIEHNGLLIVVFQINFINKREDIINICGITPKIPGCIDSSVVTAEQIKNEFLSWLT